MAELNAQLRAACQQDERRQIAGHRQPVGAAKIAERAHLLPLAEHGFELAELCFPRVGQAFCNALQCFSDLLDGIGHRDIPLQSDIRF